jgi:1-deoxy-D-xylulose-5-phosphate reductoisomerase
MAIANKETLVAAGELVTGVARECGGMIVPVDSEHSGIWQCLQGEDSSSVAEIIVTSSGGAFRDTPLEEMELATPEQALQHPTWSMGPKITIDSATLMNKGLEIIEASWLFGVTPSQVSVVLHRQSIVHALVRFADGSLKAQLSLPDMRIPIVNALTYPGRVSAELPGLDVAHLGALTFEPVDETRFPAIGVARMAAEAGGNYPAVLNAADDVAVRRFLDKEIRFMDIVPLVVGTLDRYTECKADEFEDVLAVDRWARQIAREFIP